MARLVGAAALAATLTSALALSACATTPPGPRPIIPTYNGVTPETETMMAAAPDPAVT